MIEDNELWHMLRVRDVARLLHVHMNTVRRWSDRGLIRAYRINPRGDRRYKKEDIDLFLSQLHANDGDERRITLNQSR